MQRSFCLHFKDGSFIEIKLNKITKNPTTLTKKNKTKQTTQATKTIQKTNYALFPQHIAAGLQCFCVQRFFYSTTHLSCFKLLTVLPLHALLFLYKAVCISHVFLKLKYKSKQFCIASFVAVFLIISTLFTTMILAS